jgi:hypothetical protein
MADEKDVQRLLDKVEKVTKEKKLDLSSDEDLSIGIMNLISIEEHLFFTAQKTGKDDYYELLREVREMRKELLKMIITEYEGEVWCISKHLLAGSMRLMEVGTKALGQGKTEQAKALFDKAYHLWSLFWALNLKLIGTGTVGKLAPGPAKDARADKEEAGAAASKSSVKATPSKAASDSTSSAGSQTGMMGKISAAVKKAIDCCKE